MKAKGPIPETNTLQLCRWLTRYAWRRWLGLLVVVTTMLLKIGLDVLKPWPMIFLVDYVLQGKITSPIFPRLVVLLPGAPLWKILIFSQVGNGIWLPVVVIFILLLVNRRDLMGDYVNTVTFNIVAWVTAIAMIGLTLVLTYTALFQQSVPPPP